MVRETIDNLAEQILTLEEEEIAAILPHYKRLMEDFQPTPEWERAVIAFFMISAVRVKNTLLKSQVFRQNCHFCKTHASPAPQPRLRLVK